MYKGLLKSEFNILQDLLVEMLTKNKKLII